MSDIQALIERLEKAEDGNLEFDRKITELFGKTGPNGTPHCAGYVGIGSFTSSIDAAVRLAAEVVPSANCWGFDKDERGPVEAYVSRNGVKDGRWAQFAIHNKPAIALVLAILKAHQQRGEGE